MGNSERSWKHRKAKEVHFSVGMELPTRWECDRFYREHSSCNAGPCGIKVHKTISMVHMTCRRKRGWHAVIKLDMQPSTGMWKLNKYNSHSDECVGDYLSGTTMCTVRYCCPVYTAKQVTRLLSDETEKT